MKFKNKVNNFHFKDAFENVACNITAILSSCLTPSAPTTRMQIIMYLHCIIGNRRPAITQQASMSFWHMSNIWEADDNLAISRCNSINCLIS